ncbi:MAG: hypothetical protein Kow0010_18110 [Dehalococcoidia bacterium]
MLHYNPYPHLSGPGAHRGLPASADPRWVEREAAHRRRLRELDAERRLARLAESSDAPETLVAALRRALGLA